MSNPEVKSAVAEREFSFRSVLWGCLVGLVLMALMTYLMAVLGMDINISPVGTVLGLVLIPMIGGKTNKKEVNIMQTCASAVGCSCLALPMTYVAALMLGEEFKVVELLIALVIANIIGICFVTLFKNQYINDQSLPFPQSQMCKAALDQLDVLGKKDARMLIIAIVVGAVVSFLQNLGMMPMMFDLTAKLPAGMSMGILIMPLMLGMGYIVGIKVSLVLMVASLLANLVIGPVGTSAGWFANPQLDYSTQQFFLLPVVLGISISASLIPIIKQRRAFISAFRFDAKDLSGGEDAGLLKTTLLVLAAASVALVAVCCLFYDVAVWQMIVFVLVALVFSIISVRVQAESGLSAGFALTILATFISYLLTRSASLSLIIATIVFTSMSLAMNTMGDLKTGQFVGSNAVWQIWAQVIGVVVGTIGGVVFFYFLIQTYGLEDPVFAFPVGRMNQAIVAGFEGDSSGVFHMGRFLIGCGAGLALALIQLPASAIAIAFYLAPRTIMGIVLGGVLRFVMEKVKGAETAARWNNAATGLVVGDALISIVLLFLMMSM